MNFLHKNPFTWTLRQQLPYLENKWALEVGAGGAVDGGGGDGGDFL